jgi:hypothetical protein
MSVAHAVVVKIAVGTAVVVLVGSGTAIVARRHEPHTSGRQVTAQAQPGEPPAGTQTELVVDPATGTARLLSRAGGGGAGAAGGASAAQGSGARAEAKVSPGAATLLSGGGGQSVSVGPGAATSHSTPSGSTGATVKVPNSDAAGGAGSTTGGFRPPASGGMSPGSGATSPSGPGVPSPSPSPDVRGVDVPAAPSGASTYSHGSFTVAVPGTDRVSKKLCLSGTAANGCQTVTVAALKPLDLTFAYSANAGGEAPTFTPASCPGGMTLTVAGLTPGAKVTVSANGKQVSATVPDHSTHQTASLCDA